MQDNWVDFKAVKTVVSMQAVLDRYQINWLRKHDDELRGRCPIHQGEGQNTFHVSLSKNAFHCFSCKARGNVLDFVAAMEKCSVRDAAVKLKDWFGVGDKPFIVPPEKTKSADAAGNGVGESTKPANKPLSFQLAGVDYSHPYISQRGVSKDMAEAFGIGYFSGRGSMKGRLVIPIHNERGELVAYAGRTIDDSEPRYKFPAGFHKSLELYNLHRAIGRPRVVIVEGFFHCLAVHLAGHACVALMGCSMSVEQEELLVQHFQSACVIMDGDEAGRQATDEILLRLGRRMWVWAAMLPGGKQPDTLGTEELSQLLDK